MNYWFLFKCFLVGISAASAVGPIFILTFNTSALRGFQKGFSTALGAAAADGFLLFLGLMGTLSFFENSSKYILTIDLLGGLLLLVFGLFMLFQQKPDAIKAAPTSETLLWYAFKSFSLTVLNPLTLFFFIFVSAQLLQSSTGFATRHILLGSAFASCGSLTVFGLIAYVASKIGSAISSKKLRIVSIITGTIILAIGGYFFFDAVRVLFDLYR